MKNNELYEHLVQAYMDARRNERNNKSQLEFEINLSENLRKLANELIQRTWKPGPLKCFLITKPLMREIFAPQFRDEVVSHLLFNFIEPVFDKKFIYDSYSCRKGKGVLFGINRFDHFIKSVSNNYTEEAWSLSIDISGYFMSINRPILKQIVLKGLENEPEFDFLKYLIETILDRDPLDDCIILGNRSEWSNLPPNKSLFNAPKNTGLTIGDVISQMFSNIYLDKLDQFCKRVLKCKYYCRYVDDLRILSKDKVWLESIIPQIRDFLKNELKLTVHPHKTKIENVKNVSLFLGASIRKGRIHTSKRTVNNFKMFIQTLKNCKKAGHNELSKINSYLGYFSHFREFKTIDKIFKSSPWVFELFTFTQNYKKAKLK